MPALADPRWEAACQARAEGHPIPKSHRMGGFRGSAANAYAFFRRPKIAARVLELLDAKRQVERRETMTASERLGIDKFWVLERLKFNAEVALRGTPVLDENGMQTGKFTGRPNHNAATRALHLIGVEIGMFVERLEVGGPGEFASMTDEELTEKMRNDALALGMDRESVDRLLLTYQPQAEGAE